MGDEGSGEEGGGGRYHSLLQVKEKARVDSNLLDIVALSLSDLRGFSVMTF